MYVESNVSIDVSAIRSAEDLHALLASKLEFPGYYGGNWDAFDECIRDFPPKGELQIAGIQELGNLLPKEAELLRQCLTDFEAEMPERRKVRFI